MNTGFTNDEIVNVASQFGAFMNQSGNFIDDNENVDLNNEDVVRVATTMGMFYNNTGFKIPGRGDTIEKIQFLDRFKFTIAFENESASGYQTEKILHPMMVNSVPVYWGNPTPETDFNMDSFICANGLTDEEVCDRIRQVDEDDELYNHMKSQPWFKDNKFPACVKLKNVAKKIESIL